MTEPAQHQDPASEAGGSLSVAIACGGTGGHLFPGLAIAQCLRDRGHRPVLLVSQKRVDATALKDYPDFEAVTLPAVASAGLLSPKVIPFAFGLLRGILRARGVLKRNGIDAVMGMGGFTSFPALVAARTLGRPALLHDSNAVPGRANRLGARFCREVLLGFEAAVPHFPKSECRVVGTPVRADLRNARADAGAAREHFSLEPDRKTVLVIGGSQGARGLNQMVIDSLPELASEGAPQVLHLAGELDYSRVRDGFQGYGVSNRVLDFCHEMEIAYAAADLVIARSGASTLTELSALGLPAILVPFPAAADRHQHANAAAFVDSGAAILADQDDFDGPKLAGLLTRLLGPAGRPELEAMADAMSSMAVPDAPDRICDAIEAAARS